VEPSDRSETLMVLKFAKIGWPTLKPNSSFVSATLN
jgi:hypothetical protein